MITKITLDFSLLEAPPSLAISTLSNWTREGKIIASEASAATCPTTEANVRLNVGNPFYRKPRMFESGKATFRNLACLLFPGKDPNKLRMNEINDVVHLIKHHANQHSIFVTSRSVFLARETRRLLRENFEIWVAAPEEAVTLIQAMEKEQGDSPPVQTEQAEQRRAS
jgi:hypothetical protein